jgi:putative ABC transport system ATP-binding protein
MSRDETSAGARVTVADVVKRFRGGGGELTAIDGISLAVEPGALVAVTGASGSGKSTLLHLIGAMERADAGRIVVDDTDITALRRGGLTRYRRRIGFVFQRYHLLAALTALDNVLAPVLPYRVDFDRQARARELLAAVGLAGREHALPGQLSGGQQQRVAMARALIGRPSLLLADEPTGNLDSRTGGEILDLLLDLRGRYGMTVLMATHEQHVAARCERLVRLRDGRVVDEVDLTSGHSAEATLSRISGLQP